MARHFIKLFSLSLLTTLHFPDLSNSQSVTATFQTNPVDEDGTAMFICDVNNLGSNVVSIERTIYSRTEQLATGTQILPAVDDNFYLAVNDNTDGSKTYFLTIRGVYHITDTGTYTCRIDNTGGTTVGSQSATLSINYNPGSSDPRCSIVGSNKDLTRLSGSQVDLGCQSEKGYPAVDITWSYLGCNNNRYLPQPTLTTFGTYNSDLAITLAGDDTGGMFICTLSRPDGSFSQSCSIGPFQVIGGEECNVETTPSLTSTVVSPTSSTSSEESNKMNRMITTQGTGSSEESNKMNRMMTTQGTGSSSVPAVNKFLCVLCMLLYLHHLR